MRLRLAIRATGGAERSGPSRNLVRRRCGELPLLRPQNLCLSRCARRSRRGQGEGLIKSTGHMYRQDYVVFLRAADGKIGFLREYFDPVRAAKALDGLES
jgi:hypothetical protein